jgi:peptide/nickel transport system substrate-binding protein
MKKMPLWVTIALLVSGILVLTSCGGGGTTSAPASSSASPTGITTSVPPTTGQSTSEPIYGGTLTLVAPGDVSGFDPAVNLQMDCGAQNFVADELIGEDWAKGPAGTGETDWTAGFVGRMDLETGSLAESWELPDNETILFHVRQGVKWQNKAPVNGRDFVAADVVWNINRNFTYQKAYLYGAIGPTLKPISWRTVDKYTAEVKVPSASQGLLLIMLGDFMWQVPHDVIDTYGDMTNWKNVSGTGPFFLTDFVSATSQTYTRNPNYWKKDPVHPANQLPYVDKVKMLVIPDSSTMQAALRTARADSLGALIHDDATSLMKTTPQLVSTRYLGTGTDALVPRLDKTDRPYADIRVRQAMNMAINKQEIVDTYYAGDAELFTYPYLPTPTYSAYYTPLDQQPQIVQDLFKYDPVKAKQLLSDAGYPNGFKVQIDCGSASVDYLSVIRNYLADVNIDMSINQMEGGKFFSVVRGKAQQDLLFKTQPTHFPGRVLAGRLESFDDAAYWETTRSRDTYNAINAKLYDADASAQILKDYGPYELSQVWGVWLPSPYLYNLWWPWVKGYHGESVLGFDNRPKWTHYIWLDTALKEEMGH